MEAWHRRMLSPNDYETTNSRPRGMIKPQPLSARAGESQQGAKRRTGMNLWEQHGMTERVRAALVAVHINNPDGHAFGRPFVSSYQIAIAIDAADPDLKVALGKAVGGAGTGVHQSLAQYISNELSKQIRTQGPDHFVEGVFMSNERVRAVTYRGNDGDIDSSLADTDFDMALYRLR